MKLKFIILILTVLKANLKSELNFKEIDNNLKSIRFFLLIGQNLGVNLVSSSVLDEFI